MEMPCCMRGVDVSRGLAMDTYECAKCGWILATFESGAGASCQRCGHDVMNRTERSPSWVVVRCACGHKDVYAKPVTGVRCPVCGGVMG